MYGMEPEEYIALHEKQGGKCAICQNEPTTQRGLHLDHCHDKGTFRGWLCKPCNVGIGMLGDDIAGLERAIDYLRKTDERT